MKLKQWFSGILSALFMWSAASVMSLSALAVSAQAADEPEVVVYSSRKEHLIKPVFDAFTKETGIKVSYLTGKDNALIERVKAEGRATPADVLMTVDAGNLWYAASQDLFQPIQTQQVAKAIPAHLRDPQGLWTGLSIRARTIVYSTERVKPDELSSYEALAEPQWKGRLCLRTAKKVYTKSLVSALLAHNGQDKTEQMVKGWVSNLASAPMAKDSHIMDAILAGQCDVGLVNTYYFGRLQEKQPDVALKLFWANQNSTGTHVNVSGAGVLKHAKHPELANKLLSWLVSEQAQGLFASLNKEYPANPEVPADPLVAKWGRFKQDDLNLQKVGALQADAVRLMQRMGYR
ncbi:extracellular solute-binding protein [Thiomicrorhabdus sp. zzn3]|uniref:extracellular solute-binding protein n=1 Tax=Thiomicrorhabdus sp. zzn3 TaxID=3039775 RepID=UPI002436AFEE|nr:extracellular solute-binding protein [Thiomicrorhabdus sp. zzn3]MDG6779160.1 extracellular solute-binding protein [Thiomicrorhabdus sp. zzn3]